MLIVQPKDKGEFETIVRSNSVVVVDFYSTDCPPCAALAPIFERLSESNPEVVFVKLLRQENRELAESLFVLGSPTVLFYKDGVLQDKRMTGTINENELNATIQSLLN